LITANEAEDSPLKRPAIRPDFRVKARHLKDWARDQAEMAREFFQAQTPLFAIAESVKGSPDLSKAIRRALSREFPGRVKFTSAIPREWRCIAVSVTAEASSCVHCGEPAKTLKTDFEFWDRGKVVSTPELHATPPVCPACGHVADSDEDLLELTRIILDELDKQIEQLEADRDAAVNDKELNAHLTRSGRSRRRPGLPDGHPNQGR
jgi:hypothetical protein